MAAHVSVNNGYLTIERTYFLIVHEISNVNKNYKCYTKQIVKIIVIIRN